MLDYNRKNCLPYPESIELNTYIPIQNEPFDFNNEPKNLGRPLFLQSKILNEDEATGALKNHIDKKFFYNKKILDELKFVHFDAVNISKYVLKTFVETRQTIKTYSPYEKDSIIGLNLIGKIVDPWEITVEPKCLYIDEEVRLEIPNTSHIEDCTKCFSEGKILCTHCKGSALKPCLNCNRSGSRPLPNQIKNLQLIDASLECDYCERTGYKKCPFCDKGSKVCQVCCGFGRIKCSTQLLVKFQTKTSTFISSPFPSSYKLVEKYKFERIYCEENKRVYPIKTYNDENINKASLDFLRLHDMMHLNSKIISQKHEIFVIPLSKCKFEWKNKAYDYYVCNIDFDVYNSKLPKKYCSII